MKSIITFITVAFLALTASVRAQNNGVRSDIDKDIPLAQAIERVNEQFPDSQPLTEEEVVAAVRAIKLKHPDIKDETYELYMRIVKERVIPRDMYFSRTTGWDTRYGKFQVDWKDLCLRGRVATDAEREDLISKFPDKPVANAGSIRVGGFSYRIRARFVSSQPPLTSTDE
jgi:hypothetical protein